MRLTVPALLFSMAAPVTQVVELRSLPLPYRQKAAPSVVGGLFDLDLPSTALQSNHAGQVTWLVETQDQRPVLQEIEAYAGLDAGWDGVDGRPGLDWSINAASSFAAALPNDVPDPVPMISAVGEVGLYWVSGEAYAEVGFDEMGTCFMFAEAPGVDPVHLDGRACDDPTFIVALRTVLDLSESLALAA